MKKKYVALALALVCAMCAFVGCGKDDGGKEPEKQPAVADIMTPILDNVQETGSMMDVTTEEFFVEQLKTEGLLSVDGLAEYSIYMNMMNIRTDEIGIFKMASADQAAAMQEAIKKHVENKIAGWMPGYMPEEIEKMENYTMITKGNYVMYLIASDADKEIAEEQFNAAFK
ncbi:MAG: DUF4358 domain-containing protein [Peptococcaceae bacterium]|nr:DUF4358 domain-containing protein [Peptococcaceae bacterium]